MEIHPWSIRSTKLEKEHKRLQESLTSLGNGYMGMRGNFEETYSGDSHLGTYIGGVWFPDKTRVGWWKNGYPKYFGKAINALNYSKVAIYVDGQEVDLGKHAPTDFVLELDMHSGVLHRQFTLFGVQFRISKFLSVAQKELALIRWDITATDGKTHKVRIDAVIDADVKNEDANYEEKFWQVLARDVAADRGSIATQTVANPFGLTNFIVNAEQPSTWRLHRHRPRQQRLARDQPLRAEVGATPKTFEKRVIITTSRDYGGLAAVQKAGRDLSAKISGQNHADLLAAHEAGWKQRWDIADVVISGNDEAQQGIRFNLFQLFATYYGEDARLNIGPKAFTGEKYGRRHLLGHRSLRRTTLPRSGRAERHPQPAQIPP